VEKPGCFKDRYSAISYANYVISTEFDKLLLREIDSSDDWGTLSGLFQMY
jgi:hypothetical protein